MKNCVLGWCLVAKKVQETLEILFNYFLFFLINVPFFFGICSLKTENCCLKTFVEIRVGEKVP